MEKFGQIEEWLLIYVQKGHWSLLIWLSQGLEGAFLNIYKHVL